MPKIVALLLTLWMAPVVVAQDDPCGTVPDGVEVRFVFVVDCSESMNRPVSGVSGPKRYEVVRQELNRQIDLLPEGDGVGLYLCAFSDKITTTLNYQSLDETQRELAKRKISGRDFEPVGTTALRDAVISTLRDQQRWLQQDPARRFVMVVILTDGKDSASKSSESDLIREFEKIQSFERQFSCAGHLTAAEVYLNGPANRALSNKRLAGFVQGIDASKKAVQILPISVLVSSTAMTAHPVGGRSTLQLEVNSSCPKELVQVRCPYSIEIEGMRVGSGQLSLKNGRQQVDLEFPSTFQGFAKETSGVLRLDIASLRSGSGQPLTGPQEIAFTIAAADNIELDASRINIQPPSPLVGQKVVLSYPPVPGVPGVWSRSDGGPLQQSRNGWTATATFDTPGRNAISLKGNPKAPRLSNTISVSVPVIDAKVKLAPFPDSLATGDSVTFSASVTPQADVARWRWDLNGMKQASRGPELRIDELVQSGDLRLEVSAFLKSDSGEELEISNSTLVKVSEAPFIQVDADQSVVAGKEMQVAITANQATQAILELRDSANRVLVSKPGLGLKPVFEQSSGGVKFTQKIESITVPFSPQDKSYKLVVTSSVNGRPLEDSTSLDARPPVLTYELVSPEVSGGVYELGQSKTFTLAVSGEAAELVSKVQFQPTGLSSARQVESGVRSDGVATATISGDAKDVSRVREGDSIKVTPKFFVGDQPIQPESQLSWDLMAQHKSIEYNILVPEEQVGAEILWGKSRAFSIQPMDDVAQVFWDIKMPGGLERSKQHRTLNWTFDKEGTYEISARIWRKSPGVAEVQCAPVVFEVTKQDISGNIYFPNGNFAKGETHRFEPEVEIKGSFTEAWLEWKHPDKNQPPVITPVSVVDNDMARLQSPEYTGDRVMGIQVVLWATGPDGDVQVANASVDYGGPRVILWPGLITAGLLFLLFKLYRQLMDNHPRNWMLCCSVGEPGFSNVVKTAVRSKWSWFKQDIAQKRKEGVDFTLEECFARTPRMQAQVGWWARDSRYGRAAVKLTSMMSPDRTGHIEVEFSDPIPEDLEKTYPTINGRRYLKIGQETDWSDSSTDGMQSQLNSETQSDDLVDVSVQLVVGDDVTEDEDELSDWIYIWAEQKGRRGNPVLFNLFFFIALVSSIVIGLGSWQYWFMSTNLGIL